MNVKTKSLFCKLLYVVVDADAGVGADVCLRLRVQVRWQAQFYACRRLAWLEFSVDPYNLPSSRDVSIVRCHFC